MNEVDSGSGTPDAVEVAADAVRRLTAAILESRVRGVATPDVSEKISVLADRLEAVAAHPRECVTGRIGTHEGALQRSPVSGPKNPVAIPLRFEQCDDGSSLAHTEFPRQYQGPPARARRRFGSRARRCHGGREQRGRPSGRDRGDDAALSTTDTLVYGSDRARTARARRRTQDLVARNARSRRRDDCVCDGLFITKELAL